LTYWEACLLCRLDRPEQAVAAIKAASTRGLWWAGFVWEDPDLAPIRARPEVKELEALSERRRLAAIAGAPDRPEVILLRPDVVPTSLILVLHMYGVTAADTARHWRTATAAGIAVALPRSTQPGMDGEPCWDEEETTIRDIRLAFDQVVSEIGLDRQPVILAGASQGGSRAISMALAGEPVHAAGFIGVVASAPDPRVLAETIRASASRGLRGWLVTGDRDSTRDSILAFHSSITTLGLDCRLDDVAGLAHEYPSDFARRLREAVPFLLGA
jgi:predicted esterase